MRMSVEYAIILIIFFRQKDRRIEMTKAPIIQAQKLTKVYSSGRIEVTALKDVDPVVALRHE